MSKQYNHKTQLITYIPILITLSRIALAPVIGFFIANSNWLYAAILFLLASFTDIADGFLARILNQTSVLGTIIDPIADKILLTYCYISLLFSGAKLNLLPLWFIYIIIFKEVLLILGGLILLTLKNESLRIKPTILGKLNTFFQIIFIILIFGLNYFNVIFCINIFLYFITVANVITLIQYFFLNFIKK